MFSHSVFEANLLFQKVIPLSCDWGTHILQIEPAQKGERRLPGCSHVIVSFLTDRILEEAAVPSVCVFLFSCSVRLDKCQNQQVVIPDSSVTEANLTYCPKDRFLGNGRGLPCTSINHRLPLIRYMLKFSVARKQFTF